MVSVNGTVSSNTPKMKDVNCSRCDVSVALQPKGLRSLRALKHSAEWGRGVCHSMAKRSRNGTVLVTATNSVRNSDGDCQAMLTLTGAVRGGVDGPFNEVAALDRPRPSPHWSGQMEPPCGHPGSLEVPSFKSQALL